MLKCPLFNSCDKFFFHPRDGELLIGEYVETITRFGELITLIVVNKIVPVFSVVNKCW